MDFPESVKLEAKKKAHYACVWCQRTEYFVEVHHIVAQENGGPSTLDNAAPLCPQCHTHIGPNPDMRKQLRERRDWWWTECERRSMPKYRVDVEQTNAMFERLKVMEAQGQRTESLLGDLKAIMLGAEEVRRREVKSAHTVGELVQASSGTTISPGPAAITITGFAPTVSVTNPSTQSKK
jgi:hypothetical protein